MVHDYSCNRLPSRAYFARGFESIKADLDHLSGKQAKGDSSSAALLLLRGLGALAITTIAASLQDDGDKGKQKDIQRRCF